MGSGLYFPIAAMFIIALLILLFFFKKHLNTTETKLYSWLIMTNFFGLILEFACTFASIIYDKLPIISDIIFKLYLVYIITWAIIFTMYIYVISHDIEYLLKIKKNAITILTFLYWIIIIIVFVLPIKLVTENDFAIRYTEGASVTFTYIISSIIVLIMLYCMIRNFKNIKSKKYLPLFALLIIGAGAMYIQMLNPGLLLITSVETYILLLMYFTIENPDMKMVEELIKSKSLVNIANENKTMFLYNIVQNLRNPLNETIKKIDLLREENNIKLLHGGLYEVENEIKKSDSIINKMLDMSTTSSDTIPFSNNEYDVTILFKELELKYKDKMPNNVEFISNIEEDIPRFLYGDSVRMKQIINSILINSVQNTNKGYIELSVSCIIKRDICRLLITVEDSGIGMSISDANEIFKLNQDVKSEIDSIDVSMPVVKKIIEQIGGTIILESDKGIGTKVTAIIDQRIVKMNDNFEYKNIVNNRKNIIIVDKNKLQIKQKYDKLFYENNIKVDYALYGIYLLEQVRKKYEYDLIIINENVSGESASEIVTKLINIEKYKGKILIIGSDKSNNIYNEKVDVINKDLDKNTIKKIITKYLKSK